MALFRSERGIGRGEVAESRLEAPFFAAFIMGCSLLLLVQHLYLGNDSITAALAISLLVFGITVTRVDFGVYILVIAMLLSPEIEAGYSISGERALNLRYDDVLIIVIFLGVMVKIAFENRLRLWQPSPVNAGIVAYYSVCIFSTLLALERSLGAWDRRTAMFVMLKMLEFYMVFFLVGHALRNLHEVRKQLVLFFAVALIVSGYALYTVGVEPRVSAPFEKGGTEPNTLGGYLVIVMCVAFGLFTQAHTLRLKAAFLSLCGVSFIPFLYTLSRASYLAFLVGLVALCVLSRKYAILALVVIVLLCSPFVMPEKVQERVIYTFQEDSGAEIGGLEVDKSTHERLLVWRKVRFILGIGGIFPFFGGGVSWETVMDSQYARVILETGLVGLAAFLFMQLMILKTTREAYRWTDDWVGRGVGMGMFAATLALVVHSIGTISFLIVRIMEPYWFLIAICALVRNDALAKHRARLAQPAGIQAQAAGESPARPQPAGKPGQAVNATKGAVRP